MRRTLRPGLLLTVTASATAACANPFGGDTEGPSRNPPALPREVDATFPTGPVEKYQALNPRDPEHGMIRRGSADGHCYVELPFPEPPTSVMPPPTELVACPTQMMEDPAWGGCLGGTLQVASVEPLACVCNFFGNPPPPSKESVCPREVEGRLR
ncbi:MAG: hypothetical protein Q8P18_16750 [Pseudomonadota bacterium]|nr:hypothetical protein [Pseudomonadota bacterium]